MAEVSLADLEAYQRSVLRGYPTTVATRSHNTNVKLVAAMRAFASWAFRQGHLEVDHSQSLPRPRAGKTLPASILSATEVESVLQRLAVATPTGLRDRALLEVLYSTGIRRAELTALDASDVDLERLVLTVRNGKGRRSRVVPLGMRAAHWIRRYLASARDVLGAKSADGALFLTRSGGRIRPKGLTALTRRHVVLARIGKRGSCHIFRHTMATLMHDAGADIRDIQEMLGHAQLSTTQIYTHVSMARLQAVHRATHPAEREVVKSAETPFLVPSALAREDCLRNDVAVNRAAGVQCSYHPE